MSDYRISLGFIHMKKIWVKIGFGFLDEKLISFFERMKDCEE